MKCILSWVVWSATLGLAGATTGLATTSVRAPYRAVCQHIGYCHWVGDSRVDLYLAFLDARYHSNKTGHSVKIDGLPDRLPLQCGGSSSQRSQPGPALEMAASSQSYRARCTQESWAGPVRCSWTAPVRDDLAPALSDAAIHQTTFEHVATIEYLTPGRKGTEAEGLVIVQVQKYTWSGVAVVHWPGATLGHERTEIVYDTGTTVARSLDEATTFANNQFRYGQKLRQRERQGASIHSCNVRATLEK